MAMTATGTTTPIAALAPVESPPESGDGLDVPDFELVVFALVWVGVVFRSLLCLEDCYLGEANEVHSINLPANLYHRRYCTKG